MFESITTVSPIAFVETIAERMVGIERALTLEAVRRRMIRVLKRRKVKRVYRFVCEHWRKEL